MHPDMICFQNAPPEELGAIDGAKKGKHNPEPLFLIWLEIPHRDKINNKTKAFPLL